MKKALYFLLATASLVFAGSKAIAMLQIFAAGGEPSNTSLFVTIVALVFSGFATIAYFRVDVRQKRAEIEELKRRAKRR
jgi:hypothetical protein